MTDPTAAAEVWARMLCAADVHVHGADHPTWQQLVGEPGSRIRDDYRKAAAWLVSRLTVPARQAPATDHRLSVQHADALWDAVAIPGPTEPAFTEQHQRVCKAVADILDEMTPAAVLPASVDRADVLRDFLWRLEQSAGDAAAEKFLDDNPELRRVAAETQGVPCTECGHPHNSHQEGDDPVSPGRCADCPESGEEWHDYQPAATPAAGGAQPKQGA